MRKPAMEAKVRLVLRFHRCLRIAIECPWCRLFVQDASCKICSKVVKLARLIVQMEEFQTRIQQAQADEARVGILLEWLRDRGLPIERG